MTIDAKVRFQEKQNVSNTASHEQRARAQCEPIEPATVAHTLCDEEKNSLMRAHQIIHNEYIKKIADLETRIGQLNGDKLQTTKRNRDQIDSMQRKGEFLLDATEKKWENRVAALGLQHGREIQTMRHNLVEAFEKEKSELVQQISIMVDEKRKFGEECQEKIAQARREIEETFESEKRSLLEQINGLIAERADEERLREEIHEEYASDMNDYIDKINNLIDENRENQTNFENARSALHKQIAELKEKQTAEENNQNIGRIKSLVSSNAKITEKYNNVLAQRDEYKQLAENFVEASNQNSFSAERAAYTKQIQSLIKKIAHERKDANERIEKLVEANEKSINKYKGVLRERNALQSKVRDNPDLDAGETRKFKSQISDLVEENQKLMKALNSHATEVVAEHNYNDTR